MTLMRFREITLCRAHRRAMTSSSKMPSTG